VISFLQGILNVIKRKNGFLELLTILILSTFIAAASKNGVDNKKGNTSKNKDWVLEHEDQDSVAVLLL